MVQYAYRATPNVYTTVQNNFLRNYNFIQQGWITLFKRDLKYVVTKKVKKSTFLYIILNVNVSQCYCFNCIFYLKKHGEHKTFKNIKTSYKIF